ncbi:hypothetical protein [Bradyrhizobium sp. USDA 10063]
MAVQHIHTFVAHPRKGGAGISPINGTTVSLHGKMYDLLNNIYIKSEQEADVEITFSPSVDGKQQNDCRDLIRAYLSDPTLAHGRVIAERLERNTDGRSGIGLLFLICGKEGRDHKIVISRFPTDNAIYVDEDPNKLTVEFLERVFMKNRASYKAAVYRDTSLRGGFWNGRAIDKQLNNPAGEFSNYWILDFLASQLTVTAAAGTRRLANALRAAAQKSDLSVKREIVAAATLASGLAGQRLSIDDFGRRFGLSAEACTAISSQLKAPRLAQERFTFDADEFKNIIAFKSVELSNGGTLTAPSSDFDDVFHREGIDGPDGDVRFVTQGRIVNERLRPKR